MKKSIKIGAVGLLLVVGLASCMGGNSTPPAPPKELTEVVSEAPEKEKKVKVVDVAESVKEAPKEEVVENKPTEQELQEQRELDEKVARDVKLKALQVNFKDNAIVEYSERDKGFVIIPTDENMFLAIRLLTTGTKEALTGWKDMAKSFQQMSLSIDTDDSVFFANPYNKENYLLICKNGVIVYDFTNEINFK